MTDRQKIRDSLSRIAWGFVLLSVNFNLGSINILPDFAGYLLILSAIGPNGLDPMLGSYRALSLPGGILALWTGADWLFTCLGSSLDELLPFSPVQILITVLSLYFYFRLFTDLARLAGDFLPENRDIRRRLLYWRNNSLLLTTATALAGSFTQMPAQLEWSVHTVIWALLICWAIVTAIGQLIVLFDLRGCFKDPVPAPPAPPAEPPAQGQAEADS